MPSTRPPYPPEFRQEAVRLLRSSGKTIPVLARELGVSAQSLRSWAAQAEIDAGERDGLTSEEREELRRLRRQVRILEEEREILKKAAVLSIRQRNAALRVSAGVLKPSVSRGRVLSLRAISSSAASRNVAPGIRSWVRLRA